MDERLDPREEPAPALVRLQPRAALLPLGEAVVSPQARISGQSADVGREDADQAAEELLLDRDPLLLVEADEVDELAGVDVVVALLDDQAETPPMHRYFSSSHSSIPYFEPSRPMPTPSCRRRGRPPSR